MEASNVTRTDAEEMERQERRSRDFAVSGVFFVVLFWFNAFFSFVFVLACRLLACFVLFSFMGGIQQGWDSNMEGPRGDENWGT